jgi:hypothetical protein
MKEVKHSLMDATLALYASLVALNPATVYAGDKLNPGEMLRRGERLTSGNDQYRLTMQDDGNLVLYDVSNRPLWASNTDGKAVEKCIMQVDGNLVLYLYNGQAVWASNTQGKPGSYLVLQNDGNMVIYSMGHPVWASNTVVPIAAVRPAKEPPRFKYPPDALPEANSVTFKFLTNHPTVPVIEISQSSPQGKVVRRVSGAGEQTRHKLRVGDLRPGTRYFYIITIGDAGGQPVTATGEFTTGVPID